MSLPVLFGSNNVQPNIQPNIGLDASARQSVVEILNVLLADEAVLTLKTQGAQEYTRESDRHALPPLYSTHLQQMHDIAAELMERVQILGGVLTPGLADSIQSARLDAKAGLPGVLNILASHEAFIRSLRNDAQKCSEMYEDQGTFALLVSILRKHEKMAWMLRSYIENEPVHTERRNGLSAAGRLTK